MGDYVYAGSCAGTFLALDANSGEIRWSFDVSIDNANQFHGNPLVIDSLILFGTDEGRMEIGSIYALNRFSGRPVWRSSGHSGLPSNALLAGGNTFWVTSDDSLLALSVDNGAVAWSFATGWERPRDRKYSNMIELPRLVSSPLMIDKRLIIVGRDSIAYCLNPESGQLLWSRPLGSAVTSQPLAFGDNILVGLGDYTLTTIDSEKGVVVSKDTLPALACYGMNLVDSLILFLAGFEDGRPTKVSALDLTTRKIKWTVAVNDPDPEAYWYVPRIHVRDREIMAGSTTGSVVAIDAETGRVVWEFKIDGPVRGIGHSDTMLYVGTFDGMLYAIKLPD